MKKDSLLKFILVAGVIVTTSCTFKDKEIAGTVITGNTHSKVSGTIAESNATTTNKTPNSSGAYCVRLFKIVENKSILEDSLFTDNEFEFNELGEATYSVSIDKDNKKGAWVPDFNLDGKEAKDLGKITIYIYITINININQTLIQNLYFNNEPLSPDEGEFQLLLPNQPETQIIRAQVLGEDGELIWQLYELIYQNGEWHLNPLDDYPEDPVAITPSSTSTSSSSDEPTLPSSSSFEVESSSSSLYGPSSSISSSSTVVSSSSDLLGPSSSISSSSTAVSSSSEVVSSSSEVASSSSEALSSSSEIVSSSSAYLPYSQTILLNPSVNRLIASGSNSYLDVLNTAANYRISVSGDAQFDSENDEMNGVLCLFEPDNSDPTKRAEFILVENNKSKIISPFAPRFGCLIIDRDQSTPNTGAFTVLIELETGPDTFSPFRQFILNAESDAKYLDTAPTPSLNDLDAGRPYEITISGDARWGDNLLMNGAFVLFKNETDGLLVDFIEYGNPTTIIPSDSQLHFVIFDYINPSSNYGEMQILVNGI
jgi:hypothetical protein